MRIAFLGEKIDVVMGTLCRGGRDASIVTAQLSGKILLNSNPPSIGCRDSWMQYSKAQVKLSTINYKKRRPRMASGKGAT